MRKSFVTHCPDCSEEIAVKPDFSARHLGGNVWPQNCPVCGVVHYWSVVDRSRQPHRDGDRVALADSVQEALTWDRIEHDIPNE